MRRIALLAVFAVGCSGSPTAPTIGPTTTTSAAVIPPVVSAPVAPVTVAPDPILSDPRYNRAFYEQLAHDGFQSSPLRPLKRWTRAPLIYLRTIDDQGNPVAARLLDQTAAAIINTTGLWTGKFGIAGLEQGTSTREGQDGWLTVTWNTTGVCGTTHGVGEGSRIVMNHRRPECTCGPLVAKHELGHAMGFYHTDSTTDLMTATFTGCDKNPSAREMFHASLAYQRPVGSLAP